MNKYVFLAIIIALIAQSAAAQNNQFRYVPSQDAKVQRAIGYGKTEKEALKDAFTYAVQLSVGMLISSEVYIQNGQLIDDKVIARSEGFIEKFNIVAPYDGESITIDAIVQTQYLNNELTLYKSAKIDPKGTVTTDIDGSSMLAKFDSRYEMMQARHEALRTRGVALLDELLSTRNIYIKSNTEPKPTDPRCQTFQVDVEQCQEFQFKMTLDQRINEIRYASVIGRLGRLFTSAGASFNILDDEISLAPNTIALVNIDGSINAYTFDKDTFIGLDELLSGADILSRVNYTVKINFVDRDRRTVHSIDREIYSKYFIRTVSSDRLIIDRSITLPAPELDIKIERTSLGAATAATSEYSILSVQNAIEGIKEREQAAREYEQKKEEEDNKYRQKLEKHNYFTSLNFKVAAVILDSKLDSYLSYEPVSIGVEVTNFFEVFPYIGFGIDVNYSSAKCKLSDNDTNMSKCDNVTEIEIIDSGIKGILRLPVSSFELYLAGGVAYSQIVISSVFEDYKDSFYYTTAEAGMNLCFWEVFMIGARYKQYIPQTDKYTFADNEIDTTIIKYEFLLGLRW